MSAQATQEPLILHLSAVVGCPLRDGDGERLGKVEDVIVRLGGVGYPPITRLLKVELPLSIPVLVAGLRVVVVTNISMVSVGAVIGIGGLGTWFTEGYQANKSDQIVAGILAIFVLAVIIDVALMLAGRIATPWVRVTRPGRRLLTAPVVGGSR